MKFTASSWHNRNSVVFESVCRLPNNIWGFAIRYLHEYRMERVAVNKKQAAGTKRWTITGQPGIGEPIALGISVSLNNRVAL